ncbi:MAG TPA: alpha/beta hydrolase-fold protein [Bryobacteraceae bacterium]|nr:alpha/beta hydrolase-fold protein [Bryobacteraceae bacterium]
MRVSFAVLVCAAAAVASGQQQERLESPQVHSDGSVTFRFRAPNAKEVTVNVVGSKPLAMQKNDEGVWSATTPALDPDYYGYTFIMDGVGLRDPSNADVIPNLMYPSSEVHVPGPPTLTWELNPVPHGELHHHFYHSKVVGDDRDFYVYTPPGYDPAGRTLYPVLYLLHGFSDMANGWSAVGRANVILDNLIAQNKVKPMLVVMPLGYGLTIHSIFSPGAEAPFGHNNRHEQNLTGFRDALLTEVIPQVESTYKVRTDRESRAIAGLSMGGAESLFVGLNAPDRFAYIGAFSAGGLNEPFKDEFPALDEKANSLIRVLWIACGTEDRLMEPNKNFREWLTSIKVKHTDIDTPGAHTWLVWRRNLSNFTPLLFQTH